MVVLRVGTRAAVLFAIEACTIAFLVTVSTRGSAQQSARPQAPDLGSTERRFEALENEQRRAKNAAVPLPRVAAPSTTADTKPLFRLTDVVVEGSTALRGDAIATSYACRKPCAVSSTGSMRTVPASIPCLRSMPWGDTPTINQPGR